MAEVEGQTGRRSADEPGNDEWTFMQNPAVRALLDHVAEELAAEFVKLMRASVDSESKAGSGKEKR
jgi:hypothetical protein